MASVGSARPARGHGAPSAPELTAVPRTRDRRARSPQFVRRCCRRRGHFRSVRALGAISNSPWDRLPAPVRRRSNRVQPRRRGAWVEETSLVVGHAACLCAACAKRQTTTTTERRHPPTRRRRDRQQGRHVAIRLASVESGSAPDDRRARQQGAVANQRRNKARPERVSGPCCTSGICTTEG